jgi:hypothetical protein
MSDRFVISRMLWLLVSSILVFCVFVSLLLNSYKDMRITRFYAFQDIIILCVNTDIVILKSLFNWRHWTATNSTPIHLERVDKKNEPGRILVSCSDSYMRIHSPATGELLTSTTLMSTSLPMTIYYDRSVD